MKTITGTKCLWGKTKHLRLLSGPENHKAVLKLELKSLELTPVYNLQKSSWQVERVRYLLFFPPLQNRRRHLGDARRSWFLFEHLQPPSHRTSPGCERDKSGKGYSCGQQRYHDLRGEGLADPQNWKPKLHFLAGTLNLTLLYNSDAQWCFKPEGRLSASKLRA